MSIAPLRGMKSSLVLLLVVYTFQDIDFTAVRPIGAVGPPGGPDTTPNRHVLGIHEKKSVDIKRFLAVDSNRVTVPHVILCAKSHVSRFIIVKLQEACIESGLIIEEIDISVRRVGEVPECPTVKEGMTLMGLAERPLIAEGLCAGGRSRL